MGEATGVPQVVVASEVAKRSQRGETGEACATREWDEAEPFLGAEPVSDLSEIAGGLPDERTADEIIADLRACRADSHHTPITPQAEA